MYYIVSNQLNNITSYFLRSDVCVTAIIIATFFRLIISVNYILYFCMKINSQIANLINLFKIVQVIMSKDISDIKLAT